MKGDLLFVPLHTGDDLFVFSYLNQVAGLNAPAADDFSEDALPRHNAVAHLLADSAGGVAFLANLREFQDDLFTHVKPGADGYGSEFDALGGDIFREVAVIQLEALVAHFIDAFVGQQAYLAVRGAVRVGIFFVPFFSLVQTANTEVMFTFLV
jgi:hypothetical protein